MWILHPPNRSRSDPAVIPSVLLCVISLLILDVAGNGCNKAEPGRPGASQPTGSLVAMSNCKEFDTESSERNSGEDCLHWSYDGLGTLTLQHVNTAFNCCPEYEVNLAVGEQTLLLIEQETAGLCHCLCLFDLTFEVTGLPPGTYTIEVEQEYLQPGNPTHAYELDLRAAGSGSLCVTREHYPWGRV